MPEPADRPPLRDQIAEALYRHTMDHAAGGPARLLTRDETVLWENSLARAEAVMPAVEDALAHARASCCEDGDRTYAEMERHLTQRAEEAERERDEERAIRQQAEEIIAIAHDTSNRSERERVRAVQRAETAERQHAEALDQIATERRGRLAAEAAVRRGREIHRRDDSSPHGPWCGTCLAPWPCRTYTALTIKQPKETP